MEYSSKEIKRLVESLVNEMFDDYTQRDNFIKAVADNDPFATNQRKMIDYDKLISKQISKGTTINDIHDIRYVFAKEIGPILNEVPHLMRLATFDDSSPERVIMNITFPIRKSIVSAVFHFFIRDRKLIIHLETRHYFDLNKITPEQENAIRNDKNIQNVLPKGNFLKVHYKPLKHLETIAKFEAPLEAKGKILQYFHSIIAALNNVGSIIQRSDLP